jgi:hypothetical protein
MTGMRIAMLLLGAVLAWGAAPPEAWAQRQEARPASASKAQASPARTAAAPRPAATAPRQAANRPTTTRVATQRSAQSRQAAACARRDQRGRCVQQVGPRTVAWQGGLPVASGEQAVTCPTGTIATLARGHSDVVRCLPI